MIKYFCDICGAEIVQRNRILAGLTLTTLRAGETTQIKVNIIKDEAIFCKYCFFDAVNELDDRPKECK